jgi:hypothetical protein
MPLYVTDYEGDTAHLTIEEDGAYMRLLRLCWRTPGCSVPDDKAWIYRQVRAHTNKEKGVIDTILDEFFTVEDGHFKSEFISACEKRHQKSLPRPAIPLDVVRRVVEHYGDFCFYCGCEDGPFELDHVVPWSRGGDHSFNNLVVACRACNRSKGAKTLDEWGGRQ